MANRRAAQSYNQRQLAEQAKRYTYYLDERPNYWCSLGKVHKHYFVHTGQHCPVAIEAERMGECTRDIHDVMHLAKQIRTEAEPCPMCMASAYSEFQAKWFEQYFRLALGRTVEPFDLSPYFGDVKCIHRPNCPHTEPGLIRLGYFSHLNYIAEFVFHEKLAEPRKLITCPFCMPEESASVFPRGRVTEHLYLQQTNQGALLHNFNCKHRSTAWSSFGFDQNGALVLKMAERLKSQGGLRICPDCIRADMLHQLAPETQQLVRSLLRSGR